MATGREMYQTLREAIRERRMPHGSEFRINPLDVTDLAKLSADDLMEIDITKKAMHAKLLTLCMPET